MQGVLLAESAVLLGLHPVRMILLFFRRVVVTLLALCARQCNFYSHNFHLRFNDLTYDVVFARGLNCRR